ncbi:MAG TPA: diguanylate cyclase [Geobacteraceae bacterium]|nr:diguanylate cyclase [Geobacteraceae bacterium]
MHCSVLVVEDSETVRREIVHILKGKSIFDTFFEADDGLQGFKVLLGHKIDLILCDVDMPMMDGFKFISLVQSREDLRDVPIILLTGKEDRDSKIRGLEQGASDYITKPFDAGELVARVKVHLKIKTLQDQLKQANELLLAISHTDHLTGLYNRRYLEETLEREFRRTQRKGNNLAVMILDIDHFKMVNDTYGHQQGDYVLCKIAALFQRVLREYDTAARFGGEEFIAVIPETSLSEARNIAERIRASIEETLFSVGDEKIRITASFGVSAFPAEEIRSADDLIRVADKALYSAKIKGRNRVELMPPDPSYSLSNLFAE